MDIPLFAADIVGVIFGIIFVLISIGSAIMNAAKEKNKPQPGKQKQKAALQQELEKFLQDAINPQQEKKQKPANVEVFELDEQDFKAESPVQQAPQRRRRRQQKSQPSRPQQKRQSPKSVRSSTETQSAKQHLTLRERSDIVAQERKEQTGGTLRDRIEEKHQSHISPSIHGHLTSKVNKPLVGSFGAHDDEEKRASRSEGVKVIRGLIKNPQSLRQAIILNEILSPPKSLRRS
ncbi:MAG: hypothetical protein P1V19_00010 [Gimesia sp.]|nr:hypothetical protein [Gimesia sp.]